MQRSLGSRCVHNFGTCVWKPPAVATSENKTCFDAGKIGIWYSAAVLQTQVPKLCTDLDLSLIYILILGTYSKFARKINFLALVVYCPAGQSAFRRSRPQLKLGWVCPLFAPPQSTDCCVKRAAAAHYCGSQPLFQVRNLVSPRVGRPAQGCSVHTQGGRHQGTWVKYLT